MAAGYNLVEPQQLIVQRWFPLFSAQQDNPNERPHTMCLLTPLLTPV